MKKGEQCMQSRCSDTIIDVKLARDRAMNSEHAVLTASVWPVANCVPNEWMHELPGL
jgi:hypothetical protein